MFQFEPTLTKSNPSGKVGVEYPVGMETEPPGTGMNGTVKGSPIYVVIDVGSATTGLTANTNRPGLI